MTFIKKSHVLILVVAVMVGGFIVWRAGSQKIEQPAQSQPIKIGLVPWVGDGVYYVAQEKGLFAKEHVSVEFVNVDDFTTAKQLLQTGRVDAIYLTPETVVVLSDAGVRLKIVAANDLSWGADGVIATKEIEKLEDLKGKTVAFEIGSTSHFLLSYLLEEKGMTTKDLNVFESIAPDAGAAFVAGKVDAAVTWEPWLSKANERAGGHVLVSSKDAPVIFDMPILRAEIVETRTKDVKAMLRAIFEAQKWIEANREEAASIIAKNLAIALEDAIEEMKGVRWLSYEENLNNFASGTSSTMDAIKAASDLWAKLGLIKDTINIDEIVDDSLLRDLYK